MSNNIKHDTTAVVHLVNGEDTTRVLFHIPVVSDKETRKKRFLLEDHVNGINVKAELKEYGKRENLLSHDNGVIDFNNINSFVLNKYSYILNNHQILNLEDNLHDRIAYCILHMCKKHNHFIGHKFNIEERTITITNDADSFDKQIKVVDFIRNLSLTGEIALCYALDEYSEDLYKSDYRKSIFHKEIHSIISDKLLKIVDNQNEFIKIRADFYISAGQGIGVLERANGMYYFEDEGIASTNDDMVRKLIEPTNEETTLIENVVAKIHKEIKERYDVTLNNVLIKKESVQAVTSKKTAGRPPKNKVGTGEKVEKDRKVNTNPDTTKK